MFWPLFLPLIFLSKNVVCNDPTLSARVTTAGLQFFSGVGHFIVSLVYSTHLFIFFDHLFFFQLDNYIFDFMKV